VIIPQTAISNTRRDIGTAPGERSGNVTDASHAAYGKSSVCKRMINEMCQYRAVIGGNCAMRIAVC